MSSDIRELTIHLLEQWKQGKEDSATKLFERYQERLIRLVRAKIGDDIRARVDSHAVVNSVFRVFLDNVRMDKFKVAPGDRTWKYLATIARNKVNKQIEKQLAQKRTPKRQIQDPSDANGEAALLDREPSPDEIAVVLDELNDELARMTPLQKSIVGQHLAGISIQDIAEHVDRCESLVRDILNRFGRNLERRLEQVL